MTDEQIVKALECCSLMSIPCSQCPYFQEPCVQLKLDALDLINRQKAEIERLKKENLELEIEKFKRNTKVGTLTGRITLMERNIPFIKAEAIKDFAERLKELYTDKIITDDMHCSVAVIKANIDDVVKEMIGEQE